VKLETERGRAFHQKTDIFRRTMFFSYTHEPDNFIPLPVDRVKEIMEMNKNSVKPEDLLIKMTPKVIEKKPDYENVVGQDSLTRFDKSKKPKSKNKKRNGPPNPNKPAGAPNPNANKNVGGPNPNKPNPANAPNTPNRPNNPNNPNRPNNNRPRPNNNRPRPNNSNPTNPTNPVKPPQNP
jgi:hypothetical protein